METQRFYKFKEIDRFYDIDGFLRRPKVFRSVIELLSDRCKDLGAEAIVGVDARGFILGAPIALQLGLPFVMARKEGKLPHSVQGSATYQKEYGIGDDRLSVPVGSVRPGQRIVVIDDLIATGGTIKAALDLCVGDLGAVCVGIACVVEIKALGARNRLRKSGYQVAENIIEVVDESQLHLDGASLT